MCSKGSNMKSISSLVIFWLEPQSHPGESEPFGLDRPAAQPAHHIYCPNCSPGEYSHDMELNIVWSFCDNSLYTMTEKRQPRRLGDNCQILAVRSDICKIGQLSDRTTVSADNCQIRQLSDRTTVRSDNCQIGQLSVGQLSVDHGQLSEKTVSALKKL